VYSFAGVLFPFTSHAARGTAKGTQAFNIVFYSGLAPNNPISGQLLSGNTDASLVFVQQQGWSQFCKKIPNARFMSQAWLCPVNCSQSIVQHYMNTNEKTATTWNIKKLPTFPCPSCYKPQNSKCVQCSGSTWGKGRVQWWEEGSRGIITIYCNHGGHRNPCMSVVSEGLHILYEHTMPIRHRSESTASHTGGGSRGWLSEYHWWFAK